MSKLMIHDLAQRRDLKQQEMSAVRGGISSLPELGAFAVVNVDVAQTISQVQDIQINALNNVGVIGAGFGPLALDVRPSLTAATAVAF